VKVTDGQYMDEWCWAACISGIFSYYGHPVSQARIVREAYGAIVNLPGNPVQILAAINRQWIDDNGVSFLASGNSFGLTNAIAAQELAANRPLIVGALGHATVLTALEYVRDLWGNGNVKLATVRDPWPYNPQRRALTLQEWNNITFAAAVYMR
jgi:hypothetical protein